MQNSNSNDLLKMSINDSLIQFAEDTKKNERKRQLMSQSNRKPDKLNPPERIGACATEEKMQATKIFT